ncbi:MAG TPA: AtpZ/AtpI family protein [Verrucomicrobiae bacterium]|nr:AtpZ/AtpI family protein [Verrucomicrobiae bacterium]
MKETSSNRTPKKVDQSYVEARQQFLVAAANMSWQLAIVVLVPVIGGFELDKKFDTLPALTIVGFILAMVGMAAVVWRQLQLFSPPATHNRKGSHS